MTRLARLGALSALVAALAAGCGGMELFDLAPAADGEPVQPPSSGLFYNDNTDGDYRGRSEHIFDQGIDFRGMGGQKGPAAFLDRMVAREAALVVEIPLVKGDDGTTDRDATAERVAEASGKAAALGKKLGGWVMYQSPQQVVMRVPADKLDEALERIAEFGEVLTQEVTAEDVTDRYRDNAVRLDNLQRMRQRYIQLLAMPQSVTSALRLEKQLQRINLAIARIEGTQKALEDSVRYSVISVAFAGAYRPKPGPRPGPLGWVFVGAWTFVRWLFVWY